MFEERREWIEDKNKLEKIIYKLEKDALMWEEEREMILIDRKEWTEERNKLEEKLNRQMK